MSPSRFHWLFRIVFVAYITYSSAKTALDVSGALHAPHTQFEKSVFFLATTEIVAAVALLWRRVQRPAGLVLCAVFVVAGGLEAASGAIPARFIYYAASVAIILGLDGVTREASVPVHTAQR